MKKDKGILYIATGSKYVQEAMASAKSAREQMPSLPIALFTDEDSYNSNPAIFDEIHIIQNPRFSFFDKIIPLKNSPFEKTLFVDTDTLFIDSVLELFQLLDVFDLAYCHAPWRVCPGENNQLNDVPECFTEANTGVLAYKANDDFVKLVEEWEKIYSEQLNADEPPNHDQPAFRKALYHAQIRAYVLPPEYNIRTGMPVFKGGGMKAKILHGRGPSLQRAFDTFRESNYANVIALFNFMAT